jgi:hypothetical protein
LSREINVFGVPTLSKCAEGNIVGSVMRELPTDPARSENLCMRGTFMRENREIPCSPVAVDRVVGRSGKAEAVILG